MKRLQLGARILFLFPTRLPHVSENTPNTAAVVRSRSTTMSYQNQNQSRKARAAYSPLQVESGYAATLTHKEESSVLGRSKWRVFAGVLVVALVAVGTISMATTERNAPTEVYRTSVPTHSSLSPASDLSRLPPFGFESSIRHRHPQVP